jgi:hypothetical protein
MVSRGWCLPAKSVRLLGRGGIAAGFLLVPFAVAAQPVRERVSVNVVRVTIAARDRSGALVRDLAAADLEGRR